MKPAVMSDRKKVKFAEKETPEIKPEISSDSQAAVSTEHLEVLHTIVNETCLTCLQKKRCQENPSEAHLRLLSTLCKTFGSSELVKHMYLGHTKESEAAVSEDINQEFLHHVLLPWIEETKGYDVRKAETFTAGLVDIVFMLYKLGSPIEKTDLLAAICKVFTKHCSLYNVRQLFLGNPAEESWK